MDHLLAIEREMRKIVFHLNGFCLLSGVKDLEVENRPQGWSTWVTFVISPKPPEPSQPIVRKY